MDDQDNGNDDIVSIRTERQIMEEILEMYRNLPCLWDVSNQLYKNKQARHNSLEILLTKWKTIDKNITLEGVKKKLENMRTTFSREQKKVMESMQFGSAIYQPTLWYYDHLNFLSNIFDSYSTNSPRRTTKRDPLRTEDSMIDTSIMSESSENEPSTPQETRTCLKRSQFKRKHKFTVIKKQTPVNNTPRVFTTITEDWEVFGRSIGLQLRAINKEQLTIASKLISDTIYYAKLNKLTEDSRVEINVSSPRY